MPGSGGAKKQRYESPYGSHLAITVDYIASCAHLQHLSMSLLHETRGTPWETRLQLGEHLPYLSDAIAAETDVRDVAVLAMIAHLAVASVITVDIAN